jgi:hypothetical protein
LEAGADRDHAGLAGAEHLFEAHRALHFAEEAVIPEIVEMIFRFGIEPERAIHLRTGKIDADPLRVFG